MKYAPLLRAALAAGLFTFAGATASVAGQAVAGPEMSSTPGRMSTNVCTDATGKPVTDVSVCSSGACKDSSGKPVTDPSVCASASSKEGKPSSASWNLKENTK